MAKESELAVVPEATGGKPVVKAKKDKNQELVTQVKEALKVARWQLAVGNLNLVLSPATR